MRKVIPRIRAQLSVQPDQTAKELAAKLHLPKETIRSCLWMGKQRNTFDHTSSQPYRWHCLRPPLVQEGRPPAQRLIKEALEQQPWLSIPDLVTLTGLHVRTVRTMLKNLDAVWSGEARLRYYALPGTASDPPRPEPRRGRRNGRTMVRQLLKTNPDLTIPEIAAATEIEPENIRSHLLHLRAASKWSLDCEMSLTPTPKQEPRVSSPGLEMIRGLFQKTPTLTIAEIAAATMMTPQTVMTKLCHLRATARWSLSPRATSMQSQSDVVAVPGEPETLAERDDEEED